MSEAARCESCEYDWPVILRFRAYLTKTKLIGWTMFLAGVLTFANNRFSGWDNAQRVLVWKWGWATDLLQSPVALLVVVISGLLWILFVGQPARLRGKDWIEFKRVRWRYLPPRHIVSDDGIVDLYPHCPRHDLQLLWEAYDKTKTAWKREHIEVLRGPGR